MKNKEVTFQFAKNDFNTYKIIFDEEQFSVNRDNPSIEIPSNTNTMTISYENEPLKLKNYFLLFLFQLVKILFLVFFDSTPESKWYHNATIYNFKYTYDISKTDLTDFQISINNVFVNDKANLSRKNDIISFETANIVKITEQITICYIDLKKHLIEYVSKLSWLYLIFAVFTFLLFKNKVMIVTVLISVLTIFVSILILVSVRKYRKIINNSSWHSEN